MRSPLRPANFDPMKLDVFGQQPRINKLYTQITFCFRLSEQRVESRVDIVRILQDGLERLSSSFPWTAGSVVCEHGMFVVKAMGDNVVLVKVLEDGSFSSFEDLSRAGFPMHMLDESVVAPRNTLVPADEAADGLPVFLVRANFVKGGLLLTFNGQHGSMDMAGQATLINLFAKACRGERFSDLELQTGNMDREHVVPLLSDHEAAQIIPISGDANNDPARTNSEHVALDWAYFAFSAESLSALKAQAMESVPKGRFVSTDDVFSTLVWQGVSRARLPRIRESPKPHSTLSRNVDMRRALSIPATYPGFVTDSTTHEYPIDDLVEAPLGEIAAQLREALTPEQLAQHTKAIATHIAHGNNFIAPTASEPSLDVRLSSWAKEHCYDVDFGFGKPVAIRRPSFKDGAREGLVYFLPKRLDGEIVVGLCLRNEDMGRLRTDELFSKHGTYIG